MKSLLFLLSLSAFAQSREQAELQAFLTQQAERHWAAREQRLAQLHSRPQIAAWQQHIRDYFPIAGARATLRESRHLFDLLGAGQSVDFFAFDDTHGWTQPPNARHTTILLGANPAAAPAGHRLLQFWPRGTGPGFPEPRPTGYSLRYQLAARAWLLGHNFLTWQAQDIVAAVQYVQQLYPGEQVSLLAVGPLGPAALLAAASHPSIHAVSTSQSISSFEDLLRPQPPPGYELAIVPGILQHFDLPHLIRLSKLH
jgi:hypothetical protein